MYDPRLKRGRTKREENSCRGVLDKHARTPIDAATEALLIDRTERDTHQSYQRCYPRERCSPAGRGFVLNDEIYARNSEE